MIKYPKVAGIHKIVGATRGIRNNRKDIRLVGTVKLHGTNAGINYSPQNGIKYQSRNRILTAEDDHCNFSKII